MRQKNPVARRRRIVVVVLGCTALLLAVAGLSIWAGLPSEILGALLAIAGMAAAMFVMESLENH